MKDNSHISRIPISITKYCCPLGILLAPVTTQPQDVICLPIVAGPTKHMNECSSTVFAPRNMLTYGIRSQKEI